LGKKVFINCQEWTVTKSAVWRERDPAGCQASIKKPKIKTMPSVRKYSGGSSGTRANPERGTATGPENWGNTQQSWDFFFDWSCVQRQEKQYVYMLPSGIINYTG
jgi:hypothetical protein